MLLLSISISLVCCTRASHNIRNERNGRRSRLLPSSTIFKYIDFFGFECLLFLVLQQLLLQPSSLRDLFGFSRSSQRHRSALLTAKLAEAASASASPLSPNKAVLHAYRTRTLFLPSLFAKTPARQPRTLSHDVSALLLWPCRPIKRQTTSVERARPFLRPPESGKTMHENESLRPLLVWSWVLRRTGRNRTRQTGQDRTTRKRRAEQSST